MSYNENPPNLAQINEYKGATAPKFLTPSDGISKRCEILAGDDSPAKTLGLENASVLNR